MVQATLVPVLQARLWSLCAVTAFAPSALITLQEGPVDSPCDEISDRFGADHTHNSIVRPLLVRIGGIVHPPQAGACFSI